MNVKVPLLVTFFCFSLKILGFQCLLLIALTLLIFLLSLIICVLSTTTKKTIQELLYTNPLSDSKRILGLKCTSPSETLNPRKNDSQNVNYLRPLSGKSEIDDVLHRILDLVFRDFIDSWYNVISENKEFSNEIRLLTEDCLINLIKRVKQAPLMTTITTTMLDDIAAHSKAYQDAMKMMKESQKGPKNLNKLNPSLHRRNKSESDVMWNTTSANAQRKVANSTFYYMQNDESLLDPKKQLIETFFDITGDVYKKEVNDDKALEKHFVSIMETCMYYSFDPNSFHCDSLRTAVSSIIGSLLSKLISSNIADPDFINLQIAKIFMNNTPPSDWLIKTIRQSNDLSELLSVRHLITREMDLKYKDKNCVGEISSLSFTQKIIDLRITSLQNNKDRTSIDRSSLKLTRLTLDEILSKDIALSYYLDYLQVMNLQKYVIFYCLAQDWKQIVVEKISQSSNDGTLEEKFSKDLRDRAFELFKEFLVKSSSNFLQIDQGLIEVLHIKIKDTYLNPDPSWFDSILKFLYEKLKNEHVFLQNFYESPAYKKLLAELEDNESDIPDIKFNSNQAESGSDSNSGDYLIDELDLLEDDFNEGNSLGITVHRHQRSHSDTGVLLDRQKIQNSNELNERKLAAKIINTAINSDGKFAVYAINVVTNETTKDGLKQQKSWHVYRRYKKFLELKNLLVRQFQYFKNISLPFPKKQTFHNTSRDLLERRMVILNEFLSIVCNRAETDTLVLAIVFEFLEPDNDDRQIHGTKVVKHFVNPIKSGMKTIKSVPDNVIGGLSKIFVAKNSEKFEISDMMDTNTADFPTLASFVNFLDSIFDLDARSQWLKRGIQRIILAPFVSQSTNRKIKEIVQKNILDPSVIHNVLCGVLNNTWPNGVFQESIPREDVIKLRTRMAAKIAIFAFFTDDLKHILGSETTKLGLLNFYEMLQHQTLNKRLILILLDRILTAALPTDNLTKHVIKK
ncbi:unnamed protein product [Chironomus riparius]|uniref:Sorting nexin n=1 Tax=Chironomus riparius TaxID=315576 RepID=A0A9N9S3S3_9DIPT|nr:unnamed protein product [Chironomus riparius]